MPLSILIADDHPLVRQGIRSLLERNHFEIAGEASDGIEAITMIEKSQPDIILLDHSMPRMNGISAIGQIRKASPRSKIILLTMYTDEHHILEALREGVQGCISKTQATEHLLLAVREVSMGGVYLSPSVSGAVVQAFLAKNDVPYEPLSQRERQVLQLVAEGNTTKEIAMILGVSAKTAESHRVRVMEKLDIHSTAGLVRYAIRRGLVQA